MPTDLYKEMGGCQTVREWLSFYWDLACKQDFLVGLAPPLFTSLEFSPCVFFLQALKYKMVTIE